MCWVLKDTKNDALESCLERILDISASETDTIFLLNLSDQYRNLKISNRTVILQDDLQPILNFSRLKVDVYIIIASSRNFERTASYLVHSGSWYPAAKFLIIFDDKEPIYDTVRILEQYYVWKIVICKCTEEGKSTVMTYSYNGQFEAISPWDNDKPVLFREEPPKEWEGRSLRIGYTSAWESLTSAHDMGSYTTFIWKFTHLILSRLGVDYQYVQVPRGPNEIISSSFDLRFVTEVSLTQYMDITPPLRIERVRLVTPTRKPSSWEAFTKNNGIHTQILQWVSMVLIAVILYAFGLRKSPPDTFSYCVLTVLRVELLQNVERYPKLFITLSGKLLYFLYYIKPVPSISNVQDIVNLKYTVCLTMPKNESLLQIFLDEKDHRRLKYEYSTNHYTCYRRVAVEDVVTLSSDFDAERMKLEYLFLDEGGYPLLHVLENPSRFISTSIVCRKGLPIFQKFSSSVLNLQAHGFKLNHFPPTQLKANVSRPQPKVIKLNHLHLTFKILFGGLCVSTLCFVAEIIAYRLSTFGKRTNNRQGIIAKFVKGGFCKKN
ncbi:uncharacterized protein LOC116179342 isoform X2 [Photinus pyralis]|uniref:uncharacterized protein LOC116179342 isoform X2 n=1 Tax=Photinus pyralis TaxID=7054 RepID=UPI00126707BF|nr:uncharacterized protein LOC116179342 isoform X2 [Photinus pyralis]